MRSIAEDWLISILISLDLGCITKKPTLISPLSCWSPWVLIVALILMLIWEAAHFCFLISTWANCQEAQKCHWAPREATVVPWTRTAGRTRLSSWDFTSLQAPLHGRGHVPFKRSPISGDGCLTLHPVDPQHNWGPTRTSSGLHCLSFAPPVTPPLSCPECCNCIYLPKNHPMQSSNAVSNQAELICEASILRGSPPLITHQSLSPARWVPAPLRFPPHGNWRTLTI